MPQNPLTDGLDTQCSQSQAVAITVEKLCTHSQLAIQLLLSTIIVNKEIYFSKKTLALLFDAPDYICIRLQFFQKLQLLLLLCFSTDWHISSGKDHTKIPRVLCALWLVTTSQLCCYSAKAAINRQ